MLHGFIKEIIMENTPGISAKDIMEKKFVCPEQFGAVGDGIADDTEAVKHCLRYVEQGYIWNGTAKYGISETLMLVPDQGVEYRYDFCSATLVAIAPMESMICVSHEVDHGYIPSYIQNVRLNCNSRAERGIHIVWGRALFFRDFFILNPIVAGVEVERGALYADNGMLNVLDYSLDPVGIHLHNRSTDSKILNIRMRDYSVAIKAEGAANFFYNVHAWLVRRKMEGSVFCIYHGTQHMNQCYSDTYHTSYRAVGPGTLCVTDCQFFPNTDFYKPEDPVPVIFDSTTSYRTSGRIYVKNCYFQTGSYFKKTGNKLRFVTGVGAETNTLNWMQLEQDNQIDPAHFTDLPSWVSGAPLHVTAPADAAVLQNLIRVTGENAAVQYEVRLPEAMSDAARVIGRLEEISVLDTGAPLTLPCVLGNSASGRIGMGAVRFPVGGAGDITVLGGAGFDTVSLSATLPLNWIKEKP